MNYILVCLPFILKVLSVHSYYVVVSSNAPIVTGATATFKAVLYENSGKIATGTYEYDWRDDAIPSHFRKNSNGSSTDVWNVTYNADVYPTGPYIMQVVVYKTVWFVPILITSARYEFNITNTLNGELALLQNNTIIESTFVSNVGPVIHKVKLSEPDAEYLNTNATSIFTYWFIDCIYYGMTKDYTFAYNYTAPEEEHSIEALVIVGYDPITTPAPVTTTTTTTSTTTSKPTTTTKVTTTSRTTKPSNTTNSTRKKREVTQSVANHTSSIMVRVNGTLVPYNGSFPFVCLNNNVMPDPRKTYGYFNNKVQVKAPIANLSVTGNNWLQHGELLNLSVKCQGSAIFSYCVTFHTGKYNVTGNETCNVINKNTQCNFYIQRYLRESTEHTIVIIISNDVSKIVSPVAVTVYKVQKQAQLSVIVVPVVFTLVAIVLVIFGIAYYIQNRSRFVVEVADFNFGHKYTDMEYMTFRERLRDSIANAFTRAPTPSSSEVPVWPPGSKYGSMT